VLRGLRGYGLGLFWRFVEQTQGAIGDPDFVSGKALG
jgi:hypothetical protein